jgi:hypothetical protein
VRLGLLGLAAVVVSGGSCTPSVRPLEGEPSPEPLPRTEVLRTPERVVIAWRYADRDFAMRGEGLVRLVPPDSARLDFFLNGGYGGGRAFLIGDSLIAPDAASIEQFLPPPALLWATLGRLTVQGADTTVRVDGDTLRADIGLNPRWRAAFVDGALVRLERIDGDRLREFVVRHDSSAVRYEHAAPPRRLEIEIVRREPTRGFDAEIWR